jgi:hypothetical protein
VLGVLSGCQGDPGGQEALRNAGIDLGLPYEGSAPDLGPFESDE